MYDIDVIFDVDMFLLHDIILISNPNIQTYINDLSLECVVFVSFLLLQDVCVDESISCNYQKKQPTQVFYQKEFRKISENLQENTCVEVSFLIN